MNVPPVTGIETLVDDTRILMEIGDEMAVSIDKWGIQNHPDGTGAAFPGGDAAMIRDLAREVCNVRHAQGEGTWAHILTEEYREALAEDAPDALRAELIQVAAVAALWVAAIDRRTRTGQEPNRA